MEIGMRYIFDKGFKRIWWDIAGFELFLGYNAGLTIFA
jgi:hypothetical protein